MKQEAPTSISRSSSRILRTSRTDPKLSAKWNFLARKPFECSCNSMKHRLSQLPVYHIKGKGSAPGLIRRSFIYSQDCVGIFSGWRRKTVRSERRTAYLCPVYLSELLRLIEVGASCFIHRCTGSDIRYTMSYTMSTGV